MKQNMQDLTEGPLGKKILIFSVPLMLSIIVSSFLFDILYIFNKYSNDSYYYIYNFCAFLFFIKRDILYTETRKCFHKLINQQKG